MLVQLATSGSLYVATVNGITNVLGGPINYEAINAANGYTLTNATLLKPSSSGTPSGTFLESAAGLWRFAYNANDTDELGNCKLFALFGTTANAYAFLDFEVVNYDPTALPSQTPGATMFAFLRALRASIKYPPLSSKRYP